MVKLQKVFLTLTAFFLLYCFFPRSSFASDFVFDYHVTYDVGENGITHVTQKITLTNQVSNYFAQNYTLTVNSSAIDQVTARDEGGVISPQVDKANGQTAIKLTFNTKTVGINNTHVFTLEYNSQDLAAKKGRIWEIIIPGIEKNEDIRSYRAKLNVPTNFGTAAYFSPRPNANNEWTLSELTGRGITAAFGDFQAFSFNLIYYLENASNRTQIQEITLPPDTAFQKIIVSRLSQIPDNVRIDADGNWLATYTIKPKELKKIFAEGMALIYLLPQKEFATDLDASVIDLYTQPQQYWEQTPQIVELAKKLKTPQAIYDWIVIHLIYDYQRVAPGITRLGAPAVLKNPASAVCMEFSDLFVALSRAAGIPARQLHGFAYTTNTRLQPLSLLGDILHAWPEYYDQNTKQWIPVDPTWGNTTVGVDYFSKLDFNHIVFAILGTHSNYPYPAGSFKVDEKSKAVFVDFVSDVSIPRPEYSVEIKVPDDILAGGKTNGVLTIRNTGTVLLRLNDIKIKSDLVVSVATSHVIFVPPYGTVAVPFSINTPFNVWSRRHNVTILTNGKTSQKFITTRPFYELYWFTIAGLVLFLVFGILWVYGKRKTHTPH